MDPNLHKLVEARVRLDAAVESIVVAERLTMETLGTTHDTYEAVLRCEETVRRAKAKLELLERRFLKKPK